VNAGTGGASAGTGGASAGASGESAGTFGAGGTHGGAGAGGIAMGPMCTTLPALGGRTGAAGTGGANVVVGGTGGANSGAGGMGGANAGAAEIGGANAGGPYGPADAKVSLLASVNYTWGSVPGALGIGDLNGDGKDDLVVAIGIQNGGVGVFLNKGDGTFAAPQNLAAAADAQTSTVTLGDLNDDGRTDLAVLTLPTQISNGGVSVLLNKGDGTFTDPVFYTAVSEIYSVALGDLNGDGKPDLAVAYDDGGDATGAAVFLNNGNGTFASAVNYATAWRPVSVAIGDLNGDGKPDLVAVSYISQGAQGNVSVLLNNGDGTFGAAAFYPAGDFLGFVTLADLNRDGKADLVITDAYFSVMVLLNNGNGTFAPPVTYSLDTGPLTVAVGDLDGDGSPDLALTNPLASGAGWIGGNVAVLVNDGNGTFGAPAYYPEEGAYGPIAIADLNGDGKADLVVRNMPSNCAQSLSVFLNDSR
jgi:hypothetical protein